MVAIPPIVLQKSKVADLRIFRKNAKRKTIADSYNLNHVSEAACEFNVRRWGPSHLYVQRYYRLSIVGGENFSANSRRDNKASLSERLCS
jgi:hypothetical protein